jgi:flagellar motor switch protein FliN/FliY
MADGSELVGQDEIAKLLEQAKVGGGSASATPPTSSSADPVIPAPAKLGSDEIEALLKQSSAAISGATATATIGGSGVSPLPARNEAVGGIAPGDIDYLLSQAEQALASINSPSGVEEPPSGVMPFKLVDFSGAPASTDNATIDLIREVELDVKIELGRTQMYLEDVLKLSKGAVVPLDKLAGDPVDIYVNGRLIARGEVLILNDNFCVRVAELVAGESAGAT